MSLKRREATDEKRLQADPKAVIIPLHTNSGALKGASSADIPILYKKVTGESDLKKETSNNEANL